MRSLTPLSDSKWRVTPSPKNHPIVVSSLSQWLKPPGGEGEKIQTETYPDRTLDVDRPILGVVSMHWNEDDTSKVSRKWWGGNGIPNTTTKYKEDQKVSWHTTPFEERLDKALSDDKLFPRRLMITNGGVKIQDPALYGTTNPLAAGGEEVIRWDSMFQDFKPTRINQYCC